MWMILAGPEGIHGLCPWRDMRQVPASDCSVFHADRRSCIAHSRHPRFPCDRQGRDSLRFRCRRCIGTRRYQNHSSSHSSFIKHPQNVVLFFPLWWPKRGFCPMAFQTLSAGMSYSDHLKINTPSCFRTLMHYANPSCSI